MKKLIIAAALLVGLGIVVKRFAPKFESVDWEKKFDAMPDNAPPKWMFRNIAAIRDNTDRILEMIEDRAVEGAASERTSPEDGGIGGGERA